MNQNEYINMLTAFAVEHNTIEVCNRTIQLIAAIADEVGVEGKDYLKGLESFQRCADHVADSLMSNMGHGFLTEETNKAFKILHCIQ